MTADSRTRLLNAIEQRSREVFGDVPSRYFFAPGRVNLVGAHLDYSGGDVMPMAIDRGICVGIRLRADDRIRLWSVDQPAAVEVNGSEVGDVADPRWGWGSYPLGIWRRFSGDHGVRVGFDAVFAGDLAMASGLSSSAAIEVVTAIALNTLHDLSLIHI